MVELTQEQKMFQDLKRFGVDNWDGYDIAMEYLEEEK